MQLNRMIDHTFLKPNATAEEYDAFFKAALAFDFVCVAVLPSAVPLGNSYLKGSNTHLMAAISYPRGMVPTRLKLAEVEELMEQGANEFDVVLNLEAIQSHDYQAVEREIREFRRATGSMTAKVILETPLLSDPEIERVCRIASDCGVDFVKTSTGFRGNSATVQAVELMKRSASGATRVKAAGGIGSLEKLASMLRAGAQRIGTSNGPAIVEEFRSRGGDFATLLGEGA
jgi:deoxyribose-phosphate aldolase